MVERELDLKKVPERSFNQTRNIAERLVLTCSGLRDFAEAQEIAVSIEDNLYKSATLTHIAKRQIEVGLDVSGIVSQLRQVAYRPLQPYKDTIKGYLSEIHSQESSVLKKSDPKPQLKRELKRDHNRVKMAERDENPSFQINSYTRLAVSSYQITGEYPEEYLSKAESNLRVYAGKYPTGTPLQEWRSDLAKAFASCGNFDKSSQLINEIGGLDNRANQLRMDSLFHQAQEQFARKHYKEAKTAAQSALEAGALISDESRKFYDQKVRARLYMLLVKIEFFSGEDPVSSLHFAMKEIKPQLPYSCYDDFPLIELAKTLQEINYDPSPVLDMAKKELDSISETEDYDEYDLIGQPLGYQTLAREAAEMGYIGKAEEILQTLRDFKVPEKFRENVETVEYTGYELKQLVARVLADIGCAKMKKGLTQEEIKALTSRQIAQILQEGIVKVPNKQLNVLD